MTGPTPCPLCDGTGEITYSDTTKGRGGAGGQQLTSESCGACGGTGTRAEPAPGTCKDSLQVGESGEGDDSDGELAEALQHFREGYRQGEAAAQAEVGRLQSYISAYRSAEARLVRAQQRRERNKCRLLIATLHAALVKADDLLVPNTGISRKDAVCAINDALAAHDAWKGER